MKERSTHTNLKTLLSLGSHDIQLMPTPEGRLASEGRFGLKQLLRHLLKDIIMFQDEFKHCRDFVLLASVAHISF